MNYLIFLVYYLITTILLFCIGFTIFKIFLRNKVKKISQINEDILEKAFEDL